MADDLIKEAREALSLSYEYDKENRREAAEDLRFIAGYQWSEAAKAERRGRPIITLNRSQQFLRQVSNPIRKNMPVLKVEPDRDDQSEMAEIANGLLRRIQYNSSAAHVYAHAVEHAVGCGIGWFRVVTDYMSNDTFDQEILIKRVYNPLSVYPDPAAMEPDRADMGWCIVSEPIPMETFKKRYPGRSVTGIDNPGDGTASDVAWASGDWIRVAEYWQRKEVEKTLAMLQTGQVVELTALGKDQADALQRSGMILNTRKAKGHKICMTLVSGIEQLEETYDFPCHNIPLIPVIGAEIPLDTTTYRHGLIRFQREPQQLHNYFLSLAAETLGQQPKSPYVVVAKTIAKWKSLWDNANRDPTPYLPYDPDPSLPNGGEPKRQAPPPLPAGLVEMARMMSEDMKATTGIYDAALGNRSNETSGVAIAAREEQGNQATYHYVDNLEHSLEHLGRILVDMIPKVYDTERTVRIKGDDDSERAVTLNKSVMRFGDTDIKVNDLSEMKFSSVRVVLGPSYASRRAEAVNQILQLVQAIPQVGMVAGDIIAKNLDFDGAEQLAERLKATLPPQVLQLENQEAAAAQAPPPDPMADMQMQGAAQMMQHELTSAEAKSAQEQAKAAQEAARVEGAQLDNALKVKKLREPPPNRAQPGKAGLNQPAERRAF